MKILTTVFDINNIERLSTKVDGFLIGNDKFAKTLSKSFTQLEIKHMIREIKKYNKEVFLVINKFFTNIELEPLFKFLDELPITDIDGVIFTDVGVLEYFKEKSILNKLIYNPDTLLTNDIDFNYLSKYGIRGSFLAKEITLKDIKEITDKKEYEVFMIGHGHLSMFYSKRQLVDNFMEYQNKINSYHDKRNLSLVEEGRINELFPILEDESGTHVFRSNVFSTLSVFSKIKKMIDYFIIDTIFKDDDYGYMVADEYSKRRHQKEVIDYISNKYDEKWDDGFLYKKTVYKK